MPEVLEAQRAYKQADADALKMRFRARATLGMVIARHRAAKKVGQKAVAAELGVVPEQVRRYEASFRQWKKEYPDEPLED